MVINSFCLCFDNCASTAGRPSLSTPHCIPRYKFSVFSITSPTFPPLFSIIF